MIAAVSALTCVTAYAADAGCEFPLSVVSDSITTAMTVDDCRENNWVSDTGSTSLALLDGKRAVLISGDSISASLPLGGADLSKYGSMSINLYAVGEGTADISVTGFGADHVAHVECGEWYRVYISLASAVSAESINIAASGADSLYIAGINTTTDDQASTASAMTCERLRTIVGEDVGGYTVKPTSDGSAEITASGILFGGESAVVRVTAVTGAKGSLTFSVLSEGIGKGYTDCGTVNLREGESSYLFYVRDASHLKAYRLKFTGMGAEDIEITSVSFFSLSDSFAVRSGTLTVRRSGDSAELSGTLDNDTCVKYIDGTLALYEVPYWMSEEDRFASEPLTTSGVSTKFSFKADSDSMMCPAELCRFVAAVITGDGEVIPVTSGVSLGGTSVGQTMSSFGMSTSDGLGVLESGADYAVVDVSIAAFEIGIGSGRLHTYGGRYYNMDSDALKDLDKAVRTARVSSGGIYIRIGGTYDVELEDDAYRLCALADFLCSRYTDLSGIVIGGSLSDASAVDCVERVDESVAAYQLISAVASKYMQSFRVVISVDPVSGSEDSGLVCGMLTLALHDSTVSSFFALYSCTGEGSDASEAADKCRQIYQEASTLGYSSSINLVLSWQPDSRMTASEVAECCEDIISSASSPAVSLLLEGCTATDSELFHALFSINHGGNHRTFIGKAAVGDTGSESYAKLWDFTSSYSTHGWIAAGMCTEVKTQMSSFLSNISGDGIRVLRAAFGASSAGIATAAGRQDVAFDLSGIDAVEVYLLATGNRDTVPLMITFGAKGESYRYTVELPSGVPSYVTCDVPEGASKLEHFYITSMDTGAAEVDVVSVSAVSENGFGSADQPSAEPKDHTAYIGLYVVVLGIISTALIFVAVARRDRNMKHQNGLK